MVGKRPGVSEKRLRRTPLWKSMEERTKKLAVNRLSVTENSSKGLLHLAIKMLYVVLVREVSA